MGRKVYDCCGGVGKHLGGCDKGNPKLQKPRGAKVKRGKPVPRPGTNYGERCPPHNPKPVAGRVKKSGAKYHQCSKCGKGLGWW